MKNKTLLYSIIGFGAGILATALYFNATVKPVPAANDMMMHSMTDGQMMTNSQMNMDDMMVSMMSGLEGKTGDTFDKAFLSEMIVHHQGAVDMAQAVLKNSKRPELIKLANDIIKAQTVEINMMKGWESAWFGMKK